MAGVACELPIAGARCLPDGENADDCRVEVGQAVEKRVGERWSSAETFGHSALVFSETCRESQFTYRGYVEIGFVNGVLRDPSGRFAAGFPGKLLRIVPAAEMRMGYD